MTKSRQFTLVASAFTLAVLAFAPRDIRAQGNTKVLVDAEWVIAAGSYQAEEFSTSGATFQAKVAGLKHTDKGFRVRVVNAEDVTSCTVKGGTCRELASWTQPRTAAFTNTDQIPSGRWAFLVENSENILNKMTVSVYLAVN
jgi:hypothetical protein